MEKTVYEKFGGVARPERGEEIIRGIKIFKRRVLGFCGTKTEKSLNELTRILGELNVVSSASETRELIEGLYQGELPYGNDFYLKFTKLDKEGEIYRIDKRTYPVGLHWD